MLLASTPAHAQHDASRSPRAATSAPPEAAQFDFLLGEWQVTAQPKVSSLAARIHGAPKLSGTWKAWRAMDGFGLTDELRIVDGSGNPASLSHSLRFFDASRRHWTLSTVDVYRGRISTARGEWKGNAMIVTSEGTDAEGKPVRQRVRYYDITPTSFKYQSDRSTDAGRTWEEGVLRIDARRLSPTATR